MQLRLPAIAITLLLWCGQTVPACAQVVSQWAMTNTSVRLDKQDTRKLVEMVVNTSREIIAEKPFRQVRIQNPQVLSAIPLEGGNRLQINALATGVTQVDLIGADDSVHTIEVMVLGDVRELEAILRRQFPDSNLTVVPVQQGCIVGGYVTSDEHVNLAISIAELYFPNVINKITVTGVHTVQLETQIMEVSRTKLRELGIDWALANSDDVVASSVGGILSPLSPFSATTNETFHFGIIEDSTTFFSAINALRQNNLLKVLASPTLVAVDGRPASFNAGGEFPVPIPSGLGQFGIQYKEYGTRLDFVAKVRDGGRIWLEVRPSVSEIDPTRSISISGTEVPGLRTRYAETGIELQAGQTLAIAGLLQVRTETVSRGIPLLADMPYIGNLFRKNLEQQNEIELLITVTPHFAGAMDPHQVPQVAPGLNSDSPTDKEFYGRGYIEVPMVGNACNDFSPPGLIYELPVTEQPVGGESLIPPTPAAPAAGGQTGGAISLGPNAPHLATQPSTIPHATGGSTEKPQATIR